MRRMRKNNSSLVLQELLEEYGFSRIENHETVKEIMLVDEDGTVSVMDSEIHSLFPELPSKYVYTRKMVFSQKEVTKFPEQDEFGVEYEKSFCYFKEQKKSDSCFPKECKESLCYFQKKKKNIFYSRDFIEAA